MDSFYWGPETSACNIRGSGGPGEENGANGPPERLRDVDHGGLETVPAEYHSRTHSGTVDAEVLRGNNEDMWPETVHEMGCSQVDASITITEDSGPDDKNDQSPKKRQCIPLTRTTRNILVFAGMLILSGAIAGGVAGGLLGGKNGETGSSSPNEDSSSDPNNKNGTAGNKSSSVAILSSSRLAASNWTDENEFEHRAVFFQDQYESLISRSWDSQNATWETINITELTASSDASNRPPSRGSALTTAASNSGLGGHRLLVCYVDSEDYINCLTSTSSSLSPPDPSSWQPISEIEGTLKVWPLSDLAATIQHCNPTNDPDELQSCQPGYWLIVYQNTAGGLSFANSSSWIPYDSLVDDGEAAEQTPLAFSPYWGGNGPNTAMTYQTEATNAVGSMQLLGHDAIPDEDGQVGWVVGTELLSGLERPQGPGESQFAVTKWDGWEQTLWLALAGSSGEVKANWFTGSDAVQLDKIDFGMTPESEGAVVPTWRSIAMAHGGWFYGLTEDGKLYEYRMDEFYPEYFAYSNLVYP